MQAALRGARSTHVRGWMAEECGSAALEALARHPRATEYEAFRQGRSAALDEFRRLTGWRRNVTARTVWADPDMPVDEPGYAAVEDADAESRFDLTRLTVRERQAVRLLVMGFTGREAAAIMGVDPSRIVGLRRNAAAKIDRRMIA
jgi:hypothetical protein